MERSVFFNRLSFRSSVVIFLICFLTGSAWAQEITLTPAAIDETVVGSKYTKTIHAVSATEDVGNFKIDASDLIFTGPDNKPEAAKNLAKDKVKVVQPSTFSNGTNGIDITLTLDGLLVGDYKGELTLSASKPLNPSKIPIHLEVTPAAQAAAAQAAAAQAAAAQAAAAQAAAAQAAAAQAAAAQAAAAQAAAAQAAAAQAAAAQAAAVPATLAMSLPTKSFAPTNNPSDTSASASAETYQGARVLAFRAADKSVKSGSLFYVENPDSATATIPLPTKALRVSILKQDVNATKPAETASGQLLPLLVPLSLDTMTSVQVVTRAADLYPGRYSGSFTLLVPDRSPLSIPVTLTVRNSPWSTLLPLIAGVGASLGLAFYRTKRLPLDELLARIGRLQYRIQQLPEIDPVPPDTTKTLNVFKTRLLAKSNQASIAIADGLDPVAKSRLDEADAIFARWSDRPDDWLALLKAANNLSSQINLHPMPRPTYLQVLLDKLTAAQSQAPDDNNTTPLKDNLSKYSMWFTAYQQINDEIDALSGLISDVNNRVPESARTAPEVGQFNDILSHLGNYRAIDDSDPESANTIAAGATKTRAAVLRDGIRADTETLKTILRSHAQVPSPHQIVAPASLTVPGLAKTDPIAVGQDAQSRIAVFYWVGYIILAIILVTVGFNQLYWQNPTFGASPLDYVGLFAWGFGADTLTRPVAYGLFSYLPGVPAQTGTPH